MRIGGLALDNTKSPLKIGIQNINDPSNINLQANPNYDQNTNQ